MEIKQLAEEYIPSILGNGNRVTLSRTELLESLETFGKLIEAKCIQKDEVIDSNRKEIEILLEKIGNSSFYSVRENILNEQLFCENILSIISNKLDVSIEDIKSNSRKTNRVQARSIFLTIIYLYSKISTIRLAEYINRDHSSIYNAITNCHNKHFHKGIYEKILSETGLTKQCRVWKDMK